MLLVAAGTHAVQLLVTVSQIPTMRKEIDASAGKEPEGYTALIVPVAGMVPIVVGIVITVALAAGLAVLGALVAKGRQQARIATWLVAGLLVLCNGCVLVGPAATGLLAGRLPHGTSTTTTVNTSDPYPAWVDVWNTGSGPLETLALILAIILLAVPAANDYFRKEQQLWIPPYAGPYPPAGTWPVGGGDPPSS
jgi:hypothetical protein